MHYHSTTPIEAPEGKDIVWYAKTNRFTRTMTMHKTMIASNNSSYIHTSELEQNYIVKLLLYKIDIIALLPSGHSI